METDQVVETAVSGSEPLSVWVQRMIARYGSDRVTIRPDRKPRKARSTTELTRELETTYRRVLDGGPAVRLTWRSVGAAVNGVLVLHRIKGRVDPKGEVGFRRRGKIAKIAKGNILNQLA